jgi:hypothetical protein
VADPPGIAMLNACVYAQPSALPALREPPAQPVLPEPMAL